MSTSSRLAQAGIYLYSDLGDNIFQLDHGLQASLSLLTFGLVEFGTALIFLGVLL